jgi:hypothetical protein
LYNLPSRRKIKGEWQQMDFTDGKFDRHVRLDGRVSCGIRPAVRIM